ncbi:hypothetical protein ACFLZY_00080 [Patescibacteria group bacterium]
MRLRGIDFGPVLGASGVQGFFGEGYQFHKYLRPFGLDFAGCTFVAKTTTLWPRLDNMPMRKDQITPKEFKPKCIKVNLTQGHILNSVGLSGPGAKALLEMNRWQQRTKPFLLSFMSVAKDKPSRLQELDQFCVLLKNHLVGFQTRIGLQINFSCPNVGLNPAELVNEISYALDLAASHLNIPLIPKINVEFPAQAALKISQHRVCDALCISNTIPWGHLGNQINWERLFGTKISPLAHLGGGGLSGKPLFRLVTNWIYQARYLGMTIPINAGGGILGPDDLTWLQTAGADSIFLGSIASLRPWRVQKTIERAHMLFR